MFRNNVHTNSQRWQGHQWETAGAFAATEKTLCEQKLHAHCRIRTHNATVSNILLWGWESWALTEELRRQLEVCHNRFLRRMAKINTHDAKENHITNESVREALNCRTLHQSMELKRSKWLQKLALFGYDRNPRKILKAWLPDVPRPVGGPQQSTKKSHRNTFWWKALESLTHSMIGWK